MSQIKLTSRLVYHLSGYQNAVVDSELMKFGRAQYEREFGKVSEKQLVDVLKENSKYSHVKNASSRPIGNEEAAQLQLMSLSPELSRELWVMYRDKKYLTETEIRNAYRWHESKLVYASF